MVEGRCKYGVGEDKERCDGRVWIFDLIKGKNIFLFFSLKRFEVMIFS